MKRFGLLVSVFLPFMLLACGGGGGGGTSSPSPYTGLTTPAVVTTANADNIALAAYEGVDMGATLVGPMSADGAEGTGSSAAGRPIYLTLVQNLKSAAEAALAGRGGTSAVSTRDLVPDSDTIYDGYGGSFSYSIMVDTQTGAFSGTFVFTNFRADGGGTISGSVYVSGTVNVNTGALIDIQFTFGTTTVTDGATTVSITGSIGMINGNPATVTINLYMNEQPSGKTVWLNNFTVNVTDGAGYVDVAISGRIYLPDYGYVDIATPTPLRYVGGNTNPSSGVMVLTGSSNGRIRLTAVSSTTYTVAVDADGNGIYETTNTRTW